MMLMLMMVTPGWRACKGFCDSRQEADLSVSVRRSAAYGITGRAGQRRRTATGSYHLVMGVPRDGLVLELLLDGSADDTSGAGHHGVIRGATFTSNRLGRMDAAALFDGVDDHIAIDPPPPLDGRAFTVSLWARIDTGNMRGWTHCLIAQDNGDDNDQSRRVFQLSVFDGRIVWHRMMNARDPAGRRLVVPGAWFHAAAVVDGSQHRLYVDGRLQDTVTHRSRRHPVEPIYIGRKGTPEASFFTRGAIDDVRVYNRALQPGEIAALYRHNGFVNRIDAHRLDARPISGLWGLDDQVLLDLRADEYGNVAGAVMNGRPGNLAPISRGTFHRKTGRLTIEGTAERLDTGEPAAFTVSGTLARGRLELGYRFGDLVGTVSARRVGRWLRLRHAIRTAAAWGLRVLQPIAVPIDRWRRGRLRPSKAHNARRLQARGESLSMLRFRDATVEDIPRLAALHVKTWADTYPMVRRPPTFAIRESQWIDAFAHADGSWFCIVIESGAGDLIGFAKGVRTGPESGDLNKIYLLSEYQRMGLGRRLVGHVVRRFIAQGITTMTLSADAGNPSCRFYLAIGAEYQRDDRGRIQLGAFIWRDLDALARACAADRQFT
jgi:ribosomal protein S18 acetylase RimI-like enzyme